MNMVVPIGSALENIETEALLLGKLMMDNRSIDRVADVLKPEDFADPVYGRVYAVIVREHSLGRPANPATMRPYFQGDDQIEAIGGVGFLAQLTAEPLVALVDIGVAKQIAALASRRRLIEGLQQAIGLANDPSETAETIVSRLDEAVADAIERDDGLVQQSGADCITEAMNSFGQEIQGVRCVTIEPMDRLLGHLRPKQLTILAGRPGMGKTAVAVSYACGAAQAGHGVLFISLEMPSKELGARMAADLCFDGERGVPFDVIRNGNPTVNQIRRIGQAREMLSSFALTVVDASSLTIGRIDMLVRRWKRRMAAKGQALELVIIDYVQLVNPNGRTSSRYEAVSEVSRGMKALAKEHGVSVMALAQLNRDVEKRNDKRPQLSDLKESGQIEQDADNVIFLLRDEYYLRKEEPEKDTAEHIEWYDDLQKCQGKIEFICAKARNSVEGNAMGHFYGAYQAVRG